ncbi:MAG: hypothetical protein S4CHLAM45_03130 [Chlamydiales bacterium]|nr:hypothetical protein [Chlamydiales bacterium]MCH9619171.1 hypothetical protein [Chlamydiales bacterium]MCH9622433.1 hypothetical protein [Chlamydiales bacterium]
MEIGHRLQFKCHKCKAPVLFSVLDRDKFNKGIVCTECKQKYAFDDETLVSHLNQFEALCYQIQASNEILGKTAIAIDVGSHHVKVPFNLLLTRLNSVIELNINGKVSQITFRVEPLVDAPDALMSTT